MCCFLTVLFQVHIPAPKKPDAKGNADLVPITELEPWAQLAFKGTKRLNPMQSKARNTVDIRTTMNAVISSPWTGLLYFTVVGDDVGCGWARTKISLPGSFSQTLKCGHISVSLGISMAQISSSRVVFRRTFIPT